MAGCQVDAGETTIDLGKCDNGAVKLKFNGSELKFNMQYDQKDSGKTIKLVVGGCDFKCDLVYSASNQKSSLQFTYPNAFFYFPVPVKVSSSGIVVGKDSDAKTYPCASFKSAKNNIVDFKVETGEEISGLQIRLDGATVFAGVHEESQWGVSGWRLWTCIGCGVALLLIVVVGGGIWYYRRYKKKRRDAEAAQLDKTVDSKATEKSATGTQASGKKDGDQKDGGKKAGTDAVLTGEVRKNGVNAPSHENPQAANVNNVEGASTVADVPQGSLAVLVNAPADQLQPISKNIANLRRKYVRPKHDSAATFEGIPDIV
ncbi:hypothetical protein M3Y96_00180100 [Aphelenchoides besseyi]|nr:hypothetical protein M3Y96_00180100 [Aphelenchoides besseyi]